MSKCRSCGAGIFWAVNKSGKAEPLDKEPREDGNIEIVGTGRHFDRPVPLIRHLTADDTLPGFETPPRFVSHFASCPNASTHRKKGT